MIPAWLALARADAVVSHMSALELMDLTDLIADEVHVTLPRAKRGSTIPDGVRPHFTDRPLTKRDRRQVLGIPVTGVERTVADVVRTSGWTEQVDVAVHQALRRGQTTLPRLSERLPKRWQPRLRAEAARAVLCDLAIDLRDEDLAGRGVGRVQRPGRTPPTAAARAPSPS